MEKLIAFALLVWAFPRMRYEEIKEEVRDFVILMDEEYSDHLFV